MPVRNRFFPIEGAFIIRNYSTLRYHYRMLIYILKGAGVFLLAILVGAGIYSIQKKDGGESASVESDVVEPEQINMRNEKIIPLALKDSDADGLPDWKEALWKTNPDVPDTDGDGMSDGDEVDFDRNPLVHGPNDGLSWPITVMNQYPIEKKTTAKSPTPAPVPQKTAVPEKTVSVDVGGETEPESPEKAAIRAYGNELARILKANMNGKAETEAFEYFLKEGSDQKQAQQNLAGIAAIYERRAAAIGPIAVPPDFNLVHQALIQKTTAQSVAIKRLIGFGSFSQIPESEWKSYGNTVIASGRTLYDIAALLKERGVVFSANEDGNIFALPDAQ